jgi:hypothetical protein
MRGRAQWFMDDAGGAPLVLRCALALELKQVDGVTLAISLAPLQH